jgi:hypothetical protein
MLQTYIGHLERNQFASPQSAASQYVNHRLVSFHVEKALRVILDGRPNFVDFASAKGFHIVIIRLGAAHAFQWIRGEVAPNDEPFEECIQLTSVGFDG